MVFRLLFVFSNLVSCTSPDANVSHEKQEDILKFPISNDEWNSLLSKSLDTKVKFVEIQSRANNCLPPPNPTGCFPPQFVTGYTIS